MNPYFHQQDLFEGGINGYATCRIPVMTCTPSGALLAVCEMRKDWGDWCDIDKVEILPALIYKFLNRTRLTQ